METISPILEKAKQRAADLNLPYAGALTPSEAFKILQLTQNAKLVDVRTRAELELVGRVPQATHIEWAFYPGMVANPDFSAQIKTQLDPEALTIFMCRTGGRSHNAAVLAAQLGFSEVYNMLEGFEGEATPDTKQRCKLNGWKAADLPWTNA
ncbi:rhodanese-like domain-containing protein [Candidatus Methylopumilus turicensis]|uniref:Thiosulfate sulfurtransferase n=1 Tax=Candidatus Methylopumilus turicensis TaxID=1581680 RepID=A0A0B7IX34_9PROT|nr:rhodanese-like domain-containing protein [Candidatus Methylopumilus turicensis]CEN56776.1 Thiosulfate sulfurtransferase [Candidatus Methylopumilus turicensis]